MAVGSVADSPLLQAAPAITRALCWLLLMGLCGVLGQCSPWLLHLLGTDQRGRLPSLWLLEVYPLDRLDILSCGLEPNILVEPASVSGAGSWLWG